MEFQGDVDESISVSSGSLSPDLGMWRYGCPKSPDCDSDIDFWAGSEGKDEDSEEIREEETKGLRKDCEWPSWEGMWPLEMHTMASRWKIPSKNGPRGELLLCLIEKEPAFHGEVVDFERNT